MLIDNLKIECAWSVTNGELCFWHRASYFTNYSSLDTLFQIYPRKVKCSQKSTQKVFVIKNAIQVIYWSKYISLLTLLIEQLFVSVCKLHKTWLAVEIRLKKNYSSFNSYCLTRQSFNGVVYLLNVGCYRRGVSKRQANFLIRNLLSFYCHQAKSRKTKTK